MKNLKRGMQHPRPCVETWDEWGAPLLYLATCMLKMNQEDFLTM